MLSDSPLSTAEFFQSWTQSSQTLPLPSQPSFWNILNLLLTFQQFSELLPGNRSHGKKAVLLCLVFGSSIKVLSYDYRNSFTASSSSAMPATYAITPFWEVLGIPESHL